MRESHRMEFDELKQNLVSALGEAVWAFSLLEKQSNFYIKAFSEGPMLKILAGQSYAARVKAILVLVEDAQHIGSSHQTHIKALFETSLKLAKRRNLLVHSPWSIWIDPQSTELRDHVQDSKQLEDITIDTVRRFVQEAYQLVERMALALAAVRNDLYPETEAKIYR